MRIAYYSAGFTQSGGSGTHSRGLAGAWERAGHTLLLLPDDRDAAAGRHTPERRLPAEAGPAIPVARDLRARARAARLAPGLSARLRAFAPDVMVARRGMYDYTLDDITRRVAMPYVAEFNGLSSYEQATLLGSSPPPWEQERERSFLRRAALVAAVTEETRDQAVACGAAPHRIVTAHNGTDVRRFGPHVAADTRVLSWASSWSPIVAFCGTGSYTADLAALADGVARLLGALPEAGFLVVGPASQVLLAACPPLAAHTQRLFCTGRVRHEDVPGWLAAADLYWAAYRNRYGSPLKQFEYMAMGRPMAIAGEGQAAQLVTAGECGVAVPRGDGAGLAGAVEELWRLSPARRRQLGEAGRRWVRAFATWDAVAARVLDAYSQLAR